MANVFETPYAEWLEEFIKTIVDLRPTKIGVCAILPDGCSLTGYYGGCGHQDKAIMGYQMQLDATMDVVKANAGAILGAAESQEEEKAEEE